MLTMTLPQQYSQMALTEFLETVLKAYPSVEVALGLIVDGNSAEYRAFHILSTREHTGLIQVKQRGKTFQLNRKSNLRNTAGYERYVYGLYHQDPKGQHQSGVSYRIFKKVWSAWSPTIM